MSLKTGVRKLTMTSVSVNHFYRLAAVTALLVLAMIIVSASSVRAQNGLEIVYVDDTAGGANDGTSWMDAFTDLQDALVEADTLLGGGATSVEVWVAEGTYHPHESDRAVSFELRDNVAIYGGFAGSETEREQRDWGANPTILSGDINDSGTLAGNSYNMVYAEDVDNSSVLDGFTVTGGNAEGPSFPPDDEGGGFHLRSSNPVLANLIISNNRANFGGGGMFLHDSSPLIFNALIAGNRTDSGGGGIAMFVGSSPTIVNSTISGNIAETSGASQSEGGGIEVGGSTPTVINSIIWGNHADHNPQVDIGGLGSDPPVVPEFNRSIIEGGCPDNGECENLLDANPQFVDPQLASNAPATAGDYRLQGESPAVDEGENQSFIDVANGLDRDIDGNPRFNNVDIDLGPYEFQQDVFTPLEIIYVDQSNASGTEDGASWATAFTDLQDGLAEADVSLDAGLTEVEIWVAEGTYYPTDDDDRDARFELRSNVAIYGGFAGTETEREQRDWESNETILSGDISEPNDNSDNSFTVVYGDGVDATAILDGFTVTEGNASISLSGPSNRGGGVYLLNSQATLTNLVVTNNGANWEGAGLYLTNSDATLTDLTVSNNQTQSNGGGGIYLHASDATLTDLLVIGNQTDIFAGGGIFVDQSDATLTNLIVSGNQASQFGGGLFIREDSTGTPGNVTLINLQVTGNYAGQHGGGMLLQADTTLVNVTISGNQAADNGGGIIAEVSTSAMWNSIVFGNEAGQSNNIHSAFGGNLSIADSIIEDGCEAFSITCDEESVSSDDPRFIDPEDASAAPTTDGDYRLQVGSPAIDTGDDDAFTDVAGGLDTDLDGNPRFVGDAIDTGAYEAQFSNQVLAVTVDEDLVPLGATVAVDVLLTADGVDPDFAEGLVVTLSGHNGDEDLVLDDQGEADTSFAADTAGELTLTATLGALFDEVTVTVAAPPVLDLPDDFAVPVANADEVDFDATATDWEGNDLPVDCDPASGSSFVAGDTLVECEATDSLGQTTEGSFTVTVATPPVLSVPSSFTIFESSADFVIFSASATDWQGNSLGTSCDPPSGSSFPLGVTTVTCRATDSLGQTTRRSFIVNVREAADDGNNGEAPVDPVDPPAFQNVPENITVEATASDGAIVDYDPPTATDHAGDELEVSCAPVSGSLFPIGESTVECAATDEHGQTSTVSFTVTVQPLPEEPPFDPDLPDFTCVDGFGNPYFAVTWARTDLPVQEYGVGRTWMWGPCAFAISLVELYADSPEGQREVAYFDKTRMELNDPSADPNDPWYVTNGLLAVELITGQRQFGDSLFEDYGPAEVNVAGDPDDPDSPTYASLTGLLDVPAQPVGTLLTQRLDRDGTVTEDPAYAGYGLEVGYVDAVTNHGIALPFWLFMNSSGPVWQDGMLVEELLFPNAYYATGRPITEAYWATVSVGGVDRDVLIQCFERRCLTYTPSNPPGWEVEAGNVGQHYYWWRYVLAPDL